MLLTSSISRFLQRIHYQSLCQSSLIFSMTCHNELRIANSVHYTTLATWQIGLVYSPFICACLSWLQVVPSPRLGFDLAPNEMQWSIKWWLGLPLTPEVGVCAYCPDKAHHAVTCKFGGVARHNTLRNAIFDFCKRALLNPKLEAGAGLGHERRLTRPADTLIPSWSTSDKPAAIDVSITSPLKSSILSEAGVVAGAAAVADTGGGSVVSDPPLRPDDE